MKTFAAFVAVWAAATALFGVFGCQSGGKKGLGPEHRLTDVRPDASPGEMATLSVVGSANPVDVVDTRTGDTLVLSLRVSDVEIEREVYSFAGGAFSLVEAMGMVYEPPIPLLTAVSRIGDERKWQGKLRWASERTASSTATIALSEDRLDNSDQAAILVTVELGVESGAKSAAKREMKFWFVPGKGLLQRDFASGTKRTVRVEPPEEEPSG